MGPVGVLALQGDFREHQQSLERAGAISRQVRRPADLDGISALVIPGGESTTIGRLAILYGLIDPLCEVVDGGLPTFGTCAGLIFLAAGTVKEGPPQLGCLDVIVERNAFGRQNDSFEAPIEVQGLEAPYLGVFIRAPQVSKVGPHVEVLATYDGQVVMVRQENILASAFHPELTDDVRIHEMVLSMRKGD
ncbi:MAG: pyridoxal 5'-phosphate synthase glutaminase subunit PdxT [Acidimicrobiia bacterium]|nr:pyridoxal 5'-phosphate synthase glutaminase subunit PdxT [Acidimicrobiia bacterium]